MLPGHHQPVVAVPLQNREELPPYVVRQENLAPLGSGDGKFQGYCFRLCLTEDPENRLPLPRPDNYDPQRYELVRSYLRSGGDKLKLRNFMCIGRLPNRKADINSCGFVSTNLLGANWEYPEASPQRRKEIWNEHLQWAQGLVYFLANDPVTPAAIRQEMSRWGLPKDEFVDTDHWPHQLYIREGRRMVGEYVLTQRDLQAERQKRDSIGMGGYQIDIREVEWVACDIWRYPDVRLEALHEGNFSMPIKPYEIPYRSLLPRRAECDNLLVPLCISMSTVAYASYRMEPNYMLVGHSAAIAACLAIDSHQGVHSVDIDQLQKRLGKQGQILSDHSGGGGERAIDGPAECC
jgi:hypothetical protein